MTCIRIAAITTLALCLFTACEQSDKQEKKSDAVFSALAFTDPMIGTGFHGHTYPGASLPHGRVQLSPDTHLLGWEASSGYHYADTTLYGFSHTHLSGTGIGDLGDVLFLPFTGQIPEEKPVGILNHTKESAYPGYYRIEVAPWKVKAELTATLFSGLHRYTYPVEEEARLMIDLEHILQPNWGHRLVTATLEVADSVTVRGYRKTNGWAAEDPIWFECKFDRPIHSFEIANTPNSGILYLSFGKLSEPLHARVSVSATDAEGAANNLSQAETNFDRAREAAVREWESVLGKIRITTSDTTVLKNFYTALYHTRLAPMRYSDADGRYRGMDGNTHKKTTPRYTAYSLWDTFRSWYPLMTLLEPELAKDWAYDLLDHAEEGTLLPKWPLNGNYTGTMVGYPAVALFADAMSKGLLDSIPESLLAASVKASQWQPEFHRTHQGTRAEMVMPKHIYFKEKLGYIPIDSLKESVSYGLEMAYYDWCIAQMARTLGKDSLAEVYTRKGKAWQNYFDPEAGFMRGKKADGSWDPNFNPRYSNHLESEFVEGNAWQWTPFVPHATEELATLMGGEQALGVWLDELFSTSSEIEGENASADITGLIGQYAHGNEPSHHVPYMYYHTDRPWRTGEVLDSILTTFYQPTPEGIIGNEDCGQMSAWYVLNTLGLYPVTPGIPYYYLGRPLVEEAAWDINGNTLKIKVTGQSKEAPYIRKATFNGRELKALKISHSELLKGGLLEIHMTRNPHETPLVK